jgi:hypothetical protein
MLSNILTLILEQKIVFSGYRDVKSCEFLLPENDNQDTQMTSFGFPTIKTIKRWRDVVNEKLRVRMGIFTKISNKIHLTTQNNNLGIGMNAYM